MQEPVSTSVKVGVLIVGVIVFAVAIFFFNRASVPAVPAVVEQPEEAKQVGPEGTGPLTAPDTSVAENAQTQIAEPEPLPDDIQKQIDAIARKIDSGELSIEEGQKQVYKLLGM